MTPTVPCSTWRSTVIAGNDTHTHTRGASQLLGGWVLGRGASSLTDLKDLEEGEVTEGDCSLAMITQCT